ncbi:hypothetical protein CQW23_29850 [Capsicum baccatum]|uniref:Calmodulin-binding domain-containing protein n=1 Tax=Capsicum baccatum TaxID=33114 RepID=A0A2G2VC28_CAPBA|nr:hypothetical protein CQW23_29850 [Capsicum baccatum]
MMAEDNSNEIASPVTSVKNDSMAEDNTDELVSPVTRVKNDSMDEDNIDELVSPVTSVKNDSAGSKPDKMMTIKLRSMSYGNKVLPYYRSSSSTSSYNAGNTRRQSTRKLNAPDREQDVIPHYVRASNGSFHDFCKYGRKHSSEAKPWHPLSKRKNKLLLMSRVLHGPWWGRKKKGTFFKQKLFTPPGSVLGEKKKVTKVEQKTSTSPGSMLGEAKKRTVVMQKTSTTSRSNQSDAKKGILVKQKLSTSCEYAGRGKEGEGENVTVVEQKLSTPPGSMLVEGKKEAVVNQKPSAPPRSMIGQGKKFNLVDRRPSPKMPETKKKMKSSSNILGGVDSRGKKDSVANYRKQIIAPKVSTEKYLKTPTLLSPPKFSTIKPLLLRVRSNKSLKLLAPLKDQNKMWRDGTNKFNLEMVPEKTLRTPKVKASPKSSSHLQSRPLSNEEDKRKVVKSADSALGKYISSSKKLLHIVEAKTVGKNQKKTLRKGKTGCSNDNNSSAVKLKFRRGKIVDIQQETSSPRRLTFRWGRHVGEIQDNNIRKKIFKKKGVDGDKSNTIPISEKIVLRHQDVQEKKDMQGLLNNVIEETASKLVETGKSKVKVLVGDFETVISLHNKPSVVTVS